MNNSVSVGAAHPFGEAYRNPLSNLNSVAGRFRPILSSFIKAENGGFFFRATNKVSVDIYAAFLCGLPSMAILPPANTVFSRYTMITTYNLLTLPVCTSRKIMTAVLPKIQFSATSLNYSEMAAIGITEEVAFRGVIQSYLLTDIPKQVLHTIAPQYEHLVDHKISKAARIILTSLAFALAHQNNYGDFPGMLAPQFISSCLYSYWRENGTSLAELSTVHAVFDAIIFSIKIR